MSYAAPPPPSSYSPTPQVTFDVIGEAWEMFRVQMGPWIITGIIVVVIGGGFGLLMSIPEFVVNRHQFDQSVPPPSTQVSILMTLWGFFRGIISTIIGYIFTGGMVRMAIRQLRGEQISPADLFSVGDVIGPLLLASFLCGLVSGFAALLCCFPSFIVNGLLMLTVPLVVDPRMGATDAMTGSFNALKSQWVMATCFFFVLSLLSGIGFFACCVGIFFTMPFMPLSVALTYRNFFLNAQPVPPPPLTGYAPL